jgi:hypothetical protein
MISAKAQEILDQMNLNHNDDLIDGIVGDYWRRDLTSVLCCDDTFDGIIEVDGDFYWVIDMLHGFEIKFITRQKPVYRWHEELLGDVQLTEEQKESITNELKHQLSGFNVVYETRLTPNDWELQFEDELDQVLNDVTKDI